MHKTLYFVIVNDIVSYDYSDSFINFVLEYNHGVFVWGLFLLKTLFSRDFFYLVVGR